jgi:branched-chain amino acid transport system substrate-binding protein
MGRIHVRGLVLAVGLLVAAQAWAAPSDPIKIVALYNLTGDMASIDLPAFNGAVLAAEMINQRGGLLSGRRIDLVRVDTKSEPQLAETMSEKAAASKPVAGIGYGDTTFVLAAAPTFQGRGIPFITSGATAPDLPKVFAPVLFMMTYGDDDQAAAVANFAYNKLNARNVVVWTDKTMDFSRILAGLFKEKFTELQGKILSDEPFLSGETDFAPMIKKIKEMKTNPDAIFVSAVPGDASAAVTQLRQAGIKIPILSGDGFDSDLVQSLPGPEVANNIYFSTHCYRGEKRPEVLDFIAAYKKRYGKEPENSFAALGFDTVDLLADAIVRAGTTDGQPLIQAIGATRNFKAVTGEISYSRPNHAPVKPIAIMEIKNGEYSVAETVTPK